MTSCFALFAVFYRKVRGLQWMVRAGLVLATVAPAVAAPLDVFLTATPETTAPRAYLELVTDHMNETLDFFKIRENDPQTVGTQAGDYHGTSVIGGLKVAESVWLSGALGKRSLSSTSDTFDYASWRVSGLYRFADQNGQRPAMALRLSAWGNYANATESTTAVIVPGARLNTVKITEPADRQLQADLIGSWNLTPASDTSAFVSVGSSQLSYGAMSATTTRNGCNYNVNFIGNTIFATLAPPCSVGGSIVQQFFDSSGDYGVDVANEIAWRGTFLQAGINGRWQRGPWTWQAGYLFHIVRRERVDDILKSRGKEAFAQNHNITLQATYRISPRLSIFGRGQLTSNLFFNDIPVTYNSSTAERFGSKYSVFSVGLRADF